MSEMDLDSLSPDELVQLAGEAKTKAKEKKQKQPKEAKVYQAAMAILDRYAPLAQIGNTVYRLSKAESGWIDCTDEVMRAAVIQAKCVPAQVQSMLEGFIRVPQATEYACTPYCRWMDDELETDDGVRRLNAHWEPYSLSPDCVVFRDGTYNVRTGDFKSWGSYGYTLFGPMIMMNYAEMRRASQTPTPQFNEFIQTLNTVLPDPAARRYFQSTMGTILQPHLPQKSAVFIVGPSGARKTTVATAILSAPAGVGGFAIEQINDLSDDKYAQANLIGKWANFSDDAARGKKWVSWFKRFTGSSIMRGEFKYKQARNFPTTAKLVCCCNKVPYMAEASDAIWTRLQVFQFERAGELETLFKEQAGENRKLQVDYWSDPHTRACVLAWLLDGLKDRIEGNIQPPDCVKKWNRAAVAEADPVRDILDEHFQIVPDGFVASADIRETVQPVRSFISNTEIARYMRAVFNVEPGTQNVKQVDGSFKTVRGFKGVGKR